MAHHVFNATISSFATSSSGIDLGTQSFRNAFLEIPTMTSNSELRLKAAATVDGTYRQVYHQPVNSATVAVNIFKIASSVSGIVPIPAGLRFIKVETTAIVSFSAAFKIHTSE